MKITEPCPHHTPDAGGSIDSELHGVCIFCYRDRGAALETRVEKTEKALRKMIAVFANTVDLTDPDAQMDPIMWALYKQACDLIDESEAQIR